MTNPTDSYPGDQSRTDLGASVEGERDALAPSRDAVGDAEIVVVEGSTPPASGSDADWSAQGSGDGKKEQVKQEAGQVKDTAVEAGKGVAETAKQEAADVAREAKDQARHLLDDGMAEAKAQAGQGQARLAQTVRELADELNEMVSGSSANGTVSRFASDLGSRGDDIANWLENHDPGDVVDEVRRYAARNPWAYLAIAAGAGVLVGRFVRGARENAVDERPEQRAIGSQYGAGSQYAVGSQYRDDSRYQTGSEYGGATTDAAWRDPDGTLGTGTTGTGTTGTTGRADTSDLIDEYPRLGTESAPWTDTSSEDRR